MRQGTTPPPPAPPQPPPVTAATARSVCKLPSDKSHSQMSLTPSRFFRASSKAKESPKSPEAVNGVSSSSSSSSSRAKSVPPDLKNNSKAKRVLLLNKPKSGEVVVGSQKVKEGEEAKIVVGRFVNRPAVEQFARPRRRSADFSLRKNEDDPSGKNKKELQEKLELSEDLIKNLQSEVVVLKAELDKVKSLNVELESQNRKLTENLAAAEAKVAAASTREKKETIGEHQSPKFKDIQRLIADKLERSKVKKEATIETVFVKAPTAIHAIPGAASTGRKPPPSPCLTPPPPPPLPPPIPARPPAKAANTQKAPALVDLYHALRKQEGKKDPKGSGNYHKPVAISAHSSIVGEIQNRSAHLLAIRADIETKGEFINDLIKKVVDAAYLDIEDVLKFVDWLDGELSSLADEQAVLKHFNWPERKADALREAAVEYRELKLLEQEISSYKDDPDIPCGAALKKMAILLDKSERSIQRLIKLRNSVMRSYQDFKIPTAWMLDSGIMSKVSSFMSVLCTYENHREILSNFLASAQHHHCIKLAARVYTTIRWPCASITFLHFVIKQHSMTLVKMYMKRVTMELESIRNSDRESSQESLLLQGVHFAYRAHQFAGGLDSETLCAFEEIRQRVPRHMAGSRELLAGIPSS
ncbi:protein CHUP1, chloroplastic isoform X1 [Senna tora]|uniref:Protein CHUP1, chloroplastic isoform X1 n=1 Tax=Senna tora TaxID=362788 RepID=A0A835CCL4_9FABA|nr:protein CHUP1, chloroplastic isoform X1 [Senna tora]